MKTIAVLFIFVICCFTHSTGGDDMLAKGTAAPLFELKDSNGKLFRLVDYRDNKSVVLVFYPGDATPVCTKQLCEIRDDYSSFERQGAVAFGINPASAESHGKFSAKHDFGFPLLIDERGAVAAAYGAKGPVSNKRTVYVIDKAGRIAFARRGTPSVADILAATGESAEKGASDTVR